MGCRLVLKSVTLSDLERRNGPYFALFHVFFSEFGNFRGKLRKSGGIYIPKLCATEM